MPTETIPPMTVASRTKQKKNKQVLPPQGRKSSTKGILLNFIIHKLITLSTENLAVLQGRTMTI